MDLTINGRGGGLVINTPLLCCYIETSFTRLLENKLLSELVLCTVHCTCTLQKFCVSCSLHTGTNRGPKQGITQGAKQGQKWGPNGAQTRDKTYRANKTTKPGANPEA